jgi:hypothetical protein
MRGLGWVRSDRGVEADPPLVEFFGQRIDDWRSRVMSHMAVREVERAGILDGMSAYPAVFFVYIQEVCV